jgi:hypothetical protein
VGVTLEMELWSQPTRLVQLTRQVMMLGSAASRMLAPWGSLAIHNRSPTRCWWSRTRYRHLSRGIASASRVSSSRGSHDHGGGSPSRDPDVCWVAAAGDRPPPSPSPLGGEGEGCER